MNPTSIFNHIINTMQEISVGPILVLCGDVQQQQPIETIDGKISQVESILCKRKFTSLVEKFNLHD